jgi:rubredoxin
MSFQFECPNGHLLEGTPDQAGQQCNCPTCGMLFIIPEPVEEEQVQTGPWPDASGRSKRGLGDIAPPKGPELLHIPCPNGHELETPPEMLDQEVLCPHCEAQFTLRRKNSVEFKRQEEEARIIKEVQMGKAWMQGAIIAVVLIVILLGGLLIVGYMNKK